MENSLVNQVVRNSSRQALVLKKESPHIFFGLGIVSVVVSAVLACRATLKLSPTLDEIQKDLDAIHEMNPKAHERFDGYTNDKYYKDLLYVYSKAIWKITVLYGPSLIIGGAGIALLGGSHVQMTRRNTALMAAYATLSEAYTSYRERVQKALGEETEKELYHGVRKEITPDGDMVNVIDPDVLAPYTRFFDEYSEKWQKYPDRNMIFLKCTENWFNIQLNQRGHVFLNEVYDKLGFEHTREGSLVGWIVQKGNAPTKVIDFGIMEACNSRFVNGWERSCLLEFNVDGIIYDKI